MNENSKRQDGDAKELFNSTEWLTNEVKLPQYGEIFLGQRFQTPEDFCRIDETVLDLLGIEKIGHRKRILVSCQKLATKYGLSCDVVKPSHDVVKPKQNMGDVVDSSGESGSPPALPPKGKVMGRNVKPAPPPRQPSSDDDSAATKQEINDTSTLGKNSNITAGNPSECVDSCSRSVVESNLRGNEQDMITNTDAGLNNSAGIVETTNSESLPGLPSGSPSKIDYEPLWEATEGKPLPVSPKEPIKESFSDDHLSEIDSQQMTTTSCVVDNKLAMQVDKGEDKAPPPIPPRSDLDHTPEKNHADLELSGENDLAYETMSTNNGDTVMVDTPNPPTENVEMKLEEKPSIPHKKIPPKKPPRRSKPFSMVVEPVTPLDGKQQGGRHYSLSQLENASDVDVIYENEVFFEKKEPTLPDKKVPFDNPNNNQEQIIKDVTSGADDGNIYGNVDQQSKLVPVPKSETSKITVSPKKPIPAPRKSLSEKPDNSTTAISGDGIPPELPARTGPVKNQHLLGVDNAGEGGSCTEDDLSDDDEEMPEKAPPVVQSEYETVEFPMRSPSLHPSRHSYKEGYLYKQGGQQNNKGWKKRWVVFDGNELRYYKDKEHTNESLQVVPVAIMKEVIIVTEDTKRSRFDLICEGRTYMFGLGPDDMNLIQVWAQILMGAIILCRKEHQDDILPIPGGYMSDPDKQGFLKKQGNNVVVDWKKRYVAIKGDKLAYYHNREDFIHGSPINTLMMNVASVKMDPRSHLRFQLVTPHRTYLFQSEDEKDLNSWVTAVQTAIQLALSDRTVIDKIWENPSNRYCADCGTKDPLWASVNLVVCVCEHCIGVHRKLGVHTSKPRSLIMDVKIWSPSLIKLMVEVGNEVSNKFWKYRFPEDDQISPDCSSETRNEFIRNKYQEKKYRHVSPLYGDATALGEALRQVVVTSDIETTMQLVFCGADVKYVPADGTDLRTPFELAKDANQELQMEFLLQNGGNTEADSLQSPVMLPDEGHYEDMSLYEVIGAPFDQPDTSTGSVVYEKEGYLQKKAPNAAVWRKRLFSLKGRELFYDKGDREEHGVIKLREVTEYVYNSNVNLDIVTPERTYNLRADTKEDALSWYTVLRNKQVFQVPLACQELGSDGIPHLVAKCLQFVETYGLDSEGIYRKNGTKAKIKALKKLFDQDAESVIISRDENDAHDVAGLVKEYFRELPDPLMTEDAYAHFITASLSPDHDQKMYKYKESLGRLPEVNRNTLKTVINHLVRVSAHASTNKMKLENISLIFGPTLMSNDQMGAMDTATINQEFAVIGDFISYYKWLFDVGDDEEEKDKKIEEAMKKMLELSTPKNPQVEFNELTLDVYSLNKTQESSRITVYSHSKASEICQELVSKRAMAPDGNWALFQVVNGDVERPFPATEKVLDAVIETGKYNQLSKGSYLVVKENNVAQRMQSYGFNDDPSSVAAGTLQTMKEIGLKKKDSWKKLFIKLEKGVLSVHKNAKREDDIDSWPLNETTLYLGIDRDKKPLTGFGFTIARCMKDNQCVYRYICLDDEREQYRWFSVFLKLKYPGKPLWVDPDLEPVGYYAEAMAPSKFPSMSKQKSTSKLQLGVSKNMVNELRARQKSMKK